MSENILKFMYKLESLKARAAQLASRSISVGWADGAREKPRARAKAAALAANAGKKRKRKGEFVSNFDENMTGPGRKAASLATIARVMNYGRAGGVNKSGHEYGAIPARDFVSNLKAKFMKPLRKAVMDEVLNGTGPDVNFQKLGIIAKGQLQRSMKDSNAYAPNARITVEGGWMADPATKKPFKVEPKGSSRPLWNTGTLIRAVDFEIK